jgi:hypothetical protein
MASRKTVNSELFKRAIMDEDRKRAASQARLGTAAAAVGTAEGSAGSASGETPDKAYGYEGSAPAQPPAAQTPKSVTGGSGYKAAGNDTGKIRILPDGTQWVADADGVKHFYEKSPVDQYLHGPFKSSNGNIYDFDAATDEELWSHGYVRDKNGGVRIANDMDRIAYAARNGADPAAIAAMYRQASPRVNRDGAEGPSGGDPGNTGNGKQPVHTPPAPRETGTTRETGEARQTQTPQDWRDYLDRVDYGEAPEQPEPAYELQRDEALRRARDMEWTGSGYQARRDAALEAAGSLRYDGGDYRARRDELLRDAAEPYTGSPYDARRDEALARAGEDWQGSAYQARRDEALARAEAMRWNYDPDADPVWQALRKQYRREGDRAAREALGQAALRTGGVPSSYAVTAATQAGDYYASQLSDRLPQVYDDAYNRYLREYQQQLDASDRYAGFDDRAYDRWADRQGRDLQLADRLNQYGRQDYGMYQNRVDRQLAEADRLNAYDQNAYQRYLDAYGRQLDAADRLNAYDQTAYQRYLDQYGRRLDAADRLDDYASREYDRYRDRLEQWNADRDFRYGLVRDAVGDAKYDEERDYARAWNEEERDYSRAYQARRDAILDSRADREWAQKLTEYADAQGWKQREWERYLQENGGRLSEQERRWAYAMARDAGLNERQ